MRLSTKVLTITTKKLAKLVCTEYQLRQAKRGNKHLAYKIPASGIDKIKYKYCRIIMLKVETPVQIGDYMISVSAVLAALKDYHVRYKPLGYGTKLNRLIMTDFKCTFCDYCKKSHCKGILLNHEAFGISRSRLLRIMDIREDSQGTRLVLLFTDNRNDMIDIESAKEAII